MKPDTVLRPFLVVVALSVGLSIDHVPNTWIDSGFVSSAEARPGRPATPRSAAGVARRTTRRTVRRTGAYVATLPGGCSTVTVNGAPLHYCGGTYYQSSGGQYVVVTVN